VIRGLARLLWHVARALPDPERDPDLGPFYTDLRLRWKRDPRELPPEAWEEGLLELIAERIAEGWDRHGAPSAARDPGGEMGGQLRGPRRGRHRAGGDEAGGLPLPPGQAGVVSEASWGIGSAHALGGAGRTPILP
jgi:hypothetical protein